MVLGKNASVNITHDYIAVNNPYLRLDVDAANGQSGRLNIGGDVIGTTKVIVNTLNYKDIRGEESIVFASAPNDGQETKTLSPFFALSAALICGKSNIMKPTKPGDWP